MADIRINALAQTATSTASDDFVAIDGAANGTRKLSAYSPTFGGNVTASGGELKAQGFGGSLTKGVLTLNYAGNTYLYNDGSALRLAIGGSDGLVINSSLNSTLAGNLTVSGTGNSSFAGNLLVTNSKFSFWDTGDQATYGYFEAGHFTNGTFIGTVAGSNTASDLLRFGTTNTERMRLNSSGNLLLGTTTDSSNGKLQLATHTTSAGGIGFGTVASLYTDGNNGYIALAPPSGTTAGYRLYNSTTLRGQLAYSGTDVYLDASTGSLILRTGSSTTALTLDSSQNATFAKKFGNTGTTSISGDVACSVVNLSASGYGLRVQGGASGGGYLISANDYTGTEKFQVNGNGAISIGNTVTSAASVASTHKVTISIGGVTYYLLASNV